MCKIYFSECLVIVFWNLISSARNFESETGIHIPFIRTHFKLIDNSFCVEAKIITDMRKRWYFKLFSCTFRRSVHFCPACGNVINQRCLTTAMDSLTPSST
uniref:Secreted protein n=1 Tax=Elaeophora elaphi TaxID=1147741 RepID=A0A0R3RLT9_9BILA